MKSYAYIRVSSAEQNTDRQLTAMQNLRIPSSHIYIDKQSGKDFQRPKYTELMRVLKSGDLLYVSSIDRLGRNYEEILNQWRVITKEKHADIVVLDMPILDTRAKHGNDLIGAVICDVVLQLLSYVAHSERDNIRKRQAEGIKSAKARGVKFGRPEKKMPDNFGELVKRWERREINTAEMLKQCGFGRTTLYARLKEYKLTKK
ncbi:MAG: recombinase family protein [Oscillospiraceae bacterium]|jgi:DNA invertase Pin-like site-specific DNA recombinase|nr:recombinase family protein [Oscillospiraceae bacterium]